MSLPSLDNYFALDCEMVGIRDPQYPNREVSALASLVIVDHTGKILYQSLVHVPTDQVVDWRTSKSGIAPGDLDNAPSLENVQEEVKRILKSKILVGHSVWNDLSAIEIVHPKKDVRDTALYKPLRLHGFAQYRYPSLVRMTMEVLNRKIQSGKHDPVSTTMNDFFIGSFCSLPG
ncbi:hypothetical protein TREMEDRAFT_60823 [Tremella mesenterica DSM 1558]|uniref:uncharacterized protein n=1 Tax=Tremella mesenterica (strain ATCC 24925 / CBS 8224 / DSM 1558 / NBRC 9311 / NRRL Y-6157 / RJB 2259-6 / UBC 559-6) TaxID=578456 RepID=UPI0003F497D0|nr:uncharacterized protein TREMEDRAFT_60823 [Tremella mesenterica DSM 1558]EIW70332.1 hypothetical protein TREMEDRAFT_60823 [Tremella mesenterica DSM 1558]